VKAGLLPATAAAAAAAAAAWQRGKAKEEEKLRTKGSKLKMLHNLHYKHYFSILQQFTVICRRYMSQRLRAAHHLRRHHSMMTNDKSHVCDTCHKMQAYVW
jgi:hypothetical protein